jgi:hypothetical protein
MDTSCIPYVFFSLFATHNLLCSGLPWYQVYILRHDCDAPELRRQVVTLGCQVVYVDYENPGFMYVSGILPFFSHTNQGTSFVAPVAVGYPLQNAVRAGHIRVTVTRLPGGLDLTELPDLR